MSRRLFIILIAIAVTLVVLPLLAAQAIGYWGIRR
jgi:hypothetical protein